MDEFVSGFCMFDDGVSFVFEVFVGFGVFGCIGSMFSMVDDIVMWMWFFGFVFIDELLVLDVFVLVLWIEM